METETSTTPNIRPDLLDEHVVGRPYPVRDFRVQLDHTTASRHLLAIHRWWLDAASAWTDVAQAANNNSCPNAAGEAIVEGKRCLAAAQHFAPRGGAR